MKIIEAADLFCGAGGSSNGLYDACSELGLRPRLRAINHWPLAVETHRTNHPEAEHHCMSLDDARAHPSKLVKGRRLNILIASPECTHHSNARGGVPMSDQSRASAWHVLHWAETLHIDTILVENIPEFMKWGPLGANGRPVKHRRGETFTAWLNALGSLGYQLEWKIICCADYGDPTTRERFFLMARKGHKPVVWPRPTHRDPNEQAQLFDDLPGWVPAREVIDWNIKGQSIFRRKKPLAPNTMRRIMAGYRKFNGGAFIMGAGGPTGSGRPRSVDMPMNTVLTENHYGLVEPFLVVLNGTKPEQLDRTARSVDKPVPTVVGSNHIGVCQPFIVGMEHTNDIRNHDVERPMPTITQTDAWGLCEPYLVAVNHGDDGHKPDARCKSVDQPLPTVTTEPSWGVCQPFIMTVNHGHKGKQEDTGRARSIDQPLPTITTKNGLALCQPYIVNSGGPEIGGRSTELPLNTVLTREHLALVEPYVVKFYGTGGAKSVDRPLDTITSKDRFGLVNPEVIGKDAQYAVVDLRFRMLQPHELAGAMSFPKGYKFQGTRKDQVKQIGNAVPRKTAARLCRALLAS